MPMFVKAQNPTSVKRELLSMINKLSRIKTYTCQAREGVKGWDGPNANTDKRKVNRLYDSLAADNNAVISVCQSILTNPSLSRKDDLDFINNYNKMVVSFNNFRNFYSEKQDVYLNGQGLGIPEVIKVLVGDPKDLAKTVLDALKQKRKDRADLLEPYKLSGWNVVSCDKSNSTTAGLDKPKDQDGSKENIQNSNALKKGTSASRKSQK